MYQPAERQYSQFAFMWPALAAASTSEFAGLVAKRFVSLAMGDVDGAAAREPTWATPNTIALELNSVRLRDFSTAEDGVPVLLCAPFALHGAVVADLAPDHSLVAALREAGMQRLFVTDWRSATLEMRFLGIDDYLADLNVLVDQLGGTVDLVGLCQGGWLSLRLCRAVSRQGAQAGSGRRAGRHRRRAIRTVGAGRRQSSRAVS